MCPQILSLTDRVSVDPSCMLMLYIRLAPVGFFCSYDLVCGDAGLFSAHKMVLILLCCASSVGGKLCAATGQLLGASAHDNSIHSHGGQCAKGTLPHTEGQRHDCCSYVQQGMRLCR